ncbi:MAG: archease [Candidatus Thermoplasmatota archaeon]
MPRFEIIEHTADVGVRAHGSTMEEIFESAALGMMSIICDPETVEGREIKEISVEPGEPYEMLYSFLSEIIYLVDAHAFLFSRFEVRRDGERLLARAWGEPMNPEKHTLRMEVKAVTYHMLIVDVERGVAEVLFDI